MADLKISQLTGATTPLAGTEVVPLVQSSTTKKVSVANLTAGRAVSVGSLASSGSVSIGTGGPYAVGSIYSDASWGMLFTAAQASPVNAEYAWLNSAGTELARIDTNGNTTIKIGSLIQGTAGKGIDFIANTATAGSTSRLLNWYEEGTWTPSVGGNATYFAQTGRYTRVGRLVTFTATLYINLIGTGSTTTISGLPFTASQRSAVSFGEIGGLATSVVALYGLINSGATTISIRGATAASAANASITAFQNVTYLDFCGQYTV